MSWQYWQQTYRGRNTKQLNWIALINIFYVNRSLCKNDTFNINKRYPCVKFERNMMNSFFESEIKSKWGMLQPMSNETSRSKY